MIIPVLLPMGASLLDAARDVVAKLQHVSAITIHIDDDTELRKLAQVA